jgi:hypothetical protein
VTLSCTTTINVGIVALALALAVGVFLGDMTPAAVLRGFPVELLVTLVGVTLLFAIAEVNGTLERLTSRAVRVCRGHAGALPVMFFIVGFAVSTIGAGATPASALLAPPAMAVAARAGVPPLLMAVMAGNGALAGTLSPFAPTGIVAHGVMARIGLGGVVVETFAYNALAHAFVGIAGFLVLGGWRLFRRGAARAAVDEAVPPFERAHWLTAAGIAVLIGSVAGFGLDTGMVALLVATVLILLRTVEEGRAIQRMPWGVMLMVTGVTVLIALMPRAAIGRARPRPHRLVDQRRGQPGGPVVAVHRGRAVHCRGRAGHRHAGALQRPAGVGPGHVCRGRRTMLDGIRLTWSSSTSSS